MIRRKRSGMKILQAVNHSSSFCQLTTSGSVSVIPTEDTSDDIIPADGYYTAKASTIGFALSADKDILLEVKDGKITESDSECRDCL